jgi:hypothetical protein
MTEPPAWLLAFWKEIDDKTRGEGFDCFTEDAVAHLAVSDWRGREAIRANLRAFVDKGFTAHHDVVEYWDGGSLKVFLDIIRQVGVYAIVVDAKDEEANTFWHYPEGSTRVHIIF